MVCSEAKEEDSFEDYEEDSFEREVDADAQLWDAAKRIGLRMTTGELSLMSAELDLDVDDHQEEEEEPALILC